MRPIHSSQFYHDGRGPELVQVHWDGAGTQLTAIDYMNPDARSGDLWHVRFAGVQVVMVTPEEVINDIDLDEALMEHSPAAMFDLGRSRWLESFAPRHLARCSHVKLLFYDHLFDVICEQVSCHPGGWPGFEEPKEPA